MATQVFWSIGNWDPPTLCPAFSGSSCKQILRSRLSESPKCVRVYGSPKNQGASRQIPLQKKVSTERLLNAYFRPNYVDADASSHLRVLLPELLSIEVNPEFAKPPHDISHRLIEVGYGEVASDVLQEP